MRAPRRLLVAAALALLAQALGPMLAEAILVAPHALFIDHRTRSAQLFLVNPGVVPEEVTIDLRYGYPDTDSTGNVYVRLFDSIPPGAPAATAWLRAFPRRVVVQPNERQTVRILASPPADLGDGEYWSRLLVTARQVEGITPGADTTVRAGVAVEVRTVLSVTYRKGSVRTSVERSEFRPSLTRDTLTVWVGLRRGGNAAYLGTLVISVVDLAGRVRARWDTPLAVYHDLRRRFVFPLETALEPGSYFVRMRLTTQRDDLDQRNILPAPAVGDSAVVEVR